jgi:SEC-C motif-containing protein
MTKPCPCLSGLDYSECCEPYITGAKPAPSAEALMRSRYTAYVEHAIDYIVETGIQDQKNRIDINQTKAWSEKSTWLGLKILSTEKGSHEDTEGTVEFEASYEMDGVRDTHYERAIFKKKDDRWFYEKGSLAPKTVVRSSPKVGRNEPCPCGSGKKYKHCCGK